MSIWAMLSAISLPAAVSIHGMIRETAPRRWMPTCLCRRCSATQPTSAASTQGRGQYSMEPSHYVELPKSIQQEIVEKRSSK